MLRLISPCPRFYCFYIARNLFVRIPASCCKYALEERNNPSARAAGIRTESRHRDTVHDAILLAAAFNGRRLRYHVLGLPVYRYSASWIGKKRARQQHQHLFIYLYLGMALGGMLYGVVAIDLLYPVLSITVPVDIAVFLLNRKALGHN